jgi:hypothetical protein
MAEDEDEWRFSLEDLEDDQPAEAEPNKGSNVAGDFLPDETLEPGDIDLENALFVALGVVLAGLVFVAFVLALT